MPLGEPQGDHAPERVPEHVGGAVQQRRKSVREAAERGRRRERRRATVTGQIRDDQAPSVQMRLQLGEVPGGAAEAVHQQKRGAVTALERPDPDAPPLVDPLFEAGQKIFRIRHPNRLWLDHCEFEGDKAGDVKIPVLRPDKLEIQAR